MSKQAKVHTVESLLANTYEEGDCLIWKGAVHYNGNPDVYVKGKGVLNVRRVILELQGKYRKERNYVGTSCNSQLCIHPDHIRARNQKEHSTYMAHRLNNGPLNLARIAKVKASRRANAPKLDREKAAQIRESIGTCQEIADQFGVNKSMVSRIRRGQAWADEMNPWTALFAANDSNRRAA